ncbi:high affinity immunoglobulin gamma Fc receptor I-like [Neoarius graeffei]|uniref:high affinity immunoglobulin gamma Fc receptor I-like n=1 Tax=Neoarius graeffei TaxID=443677 RepID=UPI00298C5B02|nr:high affinity immunoglobulin gamma Fc receptor I-like [Neoarius graeffei]XP_060761263.1 high affinity immunoglobulin gamma Fc receptor I-like [Neoarius graeffei]
MHFFHKFIVLLTLLANARLDDIDPTPVPVKAKATVSLGEPRLFSGEPLQITCSVPDDLLSNWRYQWFRNGVLLSSTKVYSLEKAQVQQSGNYICQGEKSIPDWPYIVSSIPSDPLKVDVDGGWALLRTPLEPLIIEETTNLTCRVRNGLIPSNVIFYKDEVEIKKQTGKNLVFPRLMLEDNGSYSCRATWFKNRQFQSAHSLPSSLTVLDKLDPPRLEFYRGQRLVLTGKEVVFKCITKVNAREQGLNVEYHYTKDDNRLGPASAKSTYVIPQVNKDDTGIYACKVRVRALNVEKWSNTLQLKVWSLK